MLEITIRLKSRLMRNSLIANYVGLAGAIALISITLSVISPYYLSASNFINIGNQIAVNVILATGMTLVICSGGIDLSVGSNVAFTSIVVALFYSNSNKGDIISIISLIIGITVGASIGLFNSLIITKLKVTPVIATLGMMQILRGLALILSGGKPIYPLPERLLSVFSGFVFGVSKPIIVAMIIALIGLVLLNNTTLGRYAKCIGGNERCVEICGINLDIYKIEIYVLQGIFASLAGFVLACMMNAAVPYAASWYELDAIAVVVMGGTNLMGGKATIIGTVLAASLLGIARNGLNIMHVPSTYQQLLVGIVILIAVVMGKLRSR